MIDLTCICISYAANFGDNFCGTFGTSVLAGFALDVAQLSHPYLRDILLFAVSKTKYIPEICKSKGSETIEHLRTMMIRSLSN